VEHLVPLLKAQNQADELPSMFQKLVNGNSRLDFSKRGLMFLVCGGLSTYSSFAASCCPDAERNEADPRVDELKNGSDNNSLTR
jgi:hypothetical protein